MSTKQANTHSWSEAWAVYTNRRVLAMLFLGFAAGLPLLLVFGTLSAWLADVGIKKSTIGFISWVALLYGFKFMWAPLVDRIDLPILYKWLGHRRSWMLLAQIGVIAGLLLMAIGDPKLGLSALVWAAILVAFSSATQDITIDAWRIEAVDVDYQAAMAATYQIGYRIGMIAAGAGALYMAEYISWSAAYAAMAALMIIGVVTTLLIPEPTQRISKETWQQEEKVVSYLAKAGDRPSTFQKVSAWFIGAIVCPFTEFLVRNGKFAFLVLAFIATFRMSDITMGVMANPFYIDMGFTLSQIANVTKVFGIIMTMIGAVVGGVVVMRYGVMRILLAAAILVAMTNLTFAWFATQSADIWILALVVSGDNLAGGMAGSAFIAYMSSQTNRAYTATQYALFSSLMLLPAKFLGGFSGLIVDANGYVYFFTYAAALGIPAILLILALMYWEHKKD